LPPLHIVTVSLGIVLLVAGWVVLVQGVGVNMCTTYVSVPSGYVGRISPSYVETLYGTLVALNTSNFDIRAGEVRRFGFELNDTIGYIYVVLRGSPSSKGYSGSLVIYNASDPGDVIASTSISPIQSSSPDSLDVSSMIMKALEPGRYVVELSLNTSAHIDSFVIYGPTSRDVQRLAPEITFTPSTYDQIRIDYVCGISFSTAIIASSIAAAGSSMLVFSAIHALRLQRSVIRPVTRKKKR